MRAFIRLPTALSLFGAMIAVSIMVVVALAPVVSAHSDFEGSEPAADAVLIEPLDSITLRFATPVIGEGSSVVAFAQTSGVTTQGELAAESDTDWLAVFTPPLQGDLFRIVYAFRAEDGHLIEGEFALNAVAATTTTVATTVADDGEGTLRFPNLLRSRRRPRYQAAHSLVMSTLVHRFPHRGHRLHRVSTR